jgi:hypothetical protein
VLLPQIQPIGSRRASNGPQHRCLGEAMLEIVALFFGPLLLLVGIICHDALAGSEVHDAGGLTRFSNSNPAQYVVLAGAAVCFVSLLALAGRAP